MSTNPSYDPETALPDQSQVSEALLAVRGVAALNEYDGHKTGQLGAAETQPAVSPTGESAGEAGLAAVFRVGRKGFSQEFISKNKRYFEWLPNASDEALSTLAGWAGLPIEKKSTETGTASVLELPYNLRSAASLLGGVEAWEGEKQDVIDFMVGYASKVHEQLGKVDTSLTLDSIGISRGSELKIVLPPHNLASDASQIHEWLDVLSADLDTVLTREPNREELLLAFQEGMGFLQES